MKCLVLSDSHGGTSLMSRAIALHPDAEVIFFLGDGLSDADSLAVYFTDKAWVCVRGNCDFSGFFRNAPAMKTEEITLMGKRIVLTHGDLYDVKYGLDRLKYLGLETGADIVLFGHTHIPHEEYVPGEHPFYLFNPGSLSAPSYTFGVLTLSENSVLFSHGSL
jgi:putative phosphoesterase